MRFVAAALRLARKRGMDTSAGTRFANTCSVYAAKSAAAFGVVAQRRGAI